MKKLSLMLIALLCSAIYGQEILFTTQISPVNIADVKNKPFVEIPYLTWGGDVGFFVANGGKNTKAGSIYDKFGLKASFVQGDDFNKQVKRYLSGESPFLRGTMHMIGMASEACNLDAKTKPVNLLQLTWSAGDHLIGRKNIKTLNDLKKTKIAVQQGGPHIGLLFDILEAAKIDRKDVQLIYTTDLTGPNGPAELFRKDPSIDCCCVITPDMLGLTAGSVGTGAEGTVKDAKVVVSTQTMSRSIADVLCVRKDWYDSHKDFCDNLVAGYLKACVEIVTQRKAFNGNKLDQKYKEILQMAQDIFGKDVLPSLEIDAHGLLLDASFVGLPGNISFFLDEGNLAGFTPKMKSSLDLAINWGYAKNRHGYLAANIDYQKIAKIAGIPYEAPKTTPRIVAEGTNLFPDSQLDDRTILSFTIQFKANQEEFNIETYGSDFERAIKAASTFGNGAIVIRGHSDPTKTLVDLIKAGLDKGILTREGQAGNYSYKVQGKTLDLSKTNQIIDLIKEGAFDGSLNASPRDTMQAALNLSLTRAEVVKKSLASYAKERKVNLDISQILVTGAGISQPIVARPRNIMEAEKNMRVEFRIIKVDAESLKSTDFDY